MILLIRSTVGIAQLRCACNKYTRIHTHARTLSIPHIASILVLICCMLMSAVAAGLRRRLRVLSTRAFAS